MSAISNLQYGNRFGGEVARLAQEKLAHASVAGDVGSARYTRWFLGEAVEAEALDATKQRFNRITAQMTAAEIAGATRDNLSMLGEDANRLFTARLPEGHRLRRAIRPSVLPDAPYFGTCKFGEIVGDNNAGTLSVTQVFVANFHGDIDPTRTGSIYRLGKREFDQMFFGIHLVVDRFGTPLGFDHERGRNGVAFKTRNMTEALYSIASASTGLSREDLEARVRRPAA